MFQIFRSFGWVASHASVEPSDKIMIVCWWPVCGALLYSPGRVIWPAQNWTIRGNQIIFSCKSVEAVNWILPASAARLGMQISGAVKYPVLEVKWQQKLWLEPWNNQSRCFNCWEPAKNCPGFAAPRAKHEPRKQSLNPSRENSCFYPPHIIHHTLHRGCKVAMMLQ